MHESTMGAVEPVLGSMDLTAAQYVRPQRTRHAMAFDGSAAEYFRIWIVNLALSIVTLGIYSAWAKVRTRRYFLANTRLAGAPFDYLAEPIQILKGRLIAYSFLLALWLSAHFQVFIVYFPLLAILLLLLPWVIYRSLAFRARYTSWRGLRFRFVGTAGDAYVNYLFRPLILFVTLYLMYPWVHMHQHNYMVSGHRFGGKRFEFAVNCEGYVAPFAIAAGVGFVAYILFIAIFVGMMAATMHGQAPPPPGTPPHFPPAMLAMMGVLYVFLLALPVFVRTRYSNAMWQHTRLGKHEFECTLRARDVLWLYFSNAIAIVCTLGLAIPWAMIRMTRYRVGRFALLAGDDLDTFVAEAGAEESATGAEFLGALDMGFDIGL